MHRPAYALAVLLGPLFLESVYEKNQKYRQSFKEFGSVEPDLDPHFMQTKMTETMTPPPIPLQISLELRMNGIRRSSQGVGGLGPLTIAVFVFNDPSTVKVI